MVASNEDTVERCSKETGAAAATYVALRSADLLDPPQPWRRRLGRPGVCMSQELSTAKQDCFREPARRRGRGSASHLAPTPFTQAGEAGLLPRTSSTTRETHLSARGRRRSRSGVFAPGPRISRLPMRFRVRSTSRCSRWSASASPPPQPERTPQGAKCAWQRHTWRCPRRASLGDVSPTVEESLLRSGPADLTPSDAFPGTEYVASLAMVRFSNPASPSATASQKRPSSREPPQVP
jgi:hypothetical protein